MADGRFILESRCEYFKAMFRSGMSEGRGHYEEESDLDSQQTTSRSGRRRGKELLDVVVPGKFNSMISLNNASHLYMLFFYLQIVSWVFCGC